MSRSDCRGKNNFGELSKKLLKTACLKRMTIIMQPRSFVCFCNNSQPNQIFDSTELEGLKVEEIKKLLPEDVKTIWYNSPHFLIPLVNSEIPLQKYPMLQLKERPGVYTRPPYYLYSFDKEAKYVFIYLTIRHETKYTMPKLPIMLTFMEFKNFTFKDWYQKIKNNCEFDMEPSEMMINGVLMDDSARSAPKMNFRNFPEEISIHVEFTDATMKNIQKRVNTIMEIVETEKIYIQDLDTILNFWKVQMLARNMLSTSEQELFFKDIYSIRSYHNEFYNTLKANLNSFATCFSNIFLEYAEFFKVSVHYITTYPRMTELLTTKQQNRSFSSSLAEIQKIGDDKDFQSYLITPVQRLPRYLLFLKELCKITPHCHQDHQLMQEAFNLMDKITKEVDKLSTLAIQQNDLAKLQERIHSDTTIMAPSRRVLFSLAVSIDKSKKADNTVFLHCCNDIVFLVKEKGPKTAHLLFQSELSCFHYLPTTMGDDMTIVLSSIVKEKRYDYYVTFSRPEDKSKFFDQVKRAQSEAILKKDSDHALVWNFHSLYTPISQHASLYHERFIWFFGGILNSARMVNPSFITFDKNPLNGAPIMLTQNCLITGRRRATITYMDDRMFLIGGTGKNKEFSIINEFDIIQQKWSVAVKNPGHFMERFGHTTVAYNHLLYVFGGKTHAPSFLNDVSEINPKDECIKEMHFNVAPQPRCGHTAIVFEQKMYIFGGKGPNKKIYNDLWAYDFKSCRWSQCKIIGAAVDARRDHIAFMIGYEMVIMGGCIKGKSGNSIAINLRTFTCKNIDDFGNFPYSLRHSAGAYFPDLNEIIIYGGNEAASKNPSSAIYCISIDARWKRDLQQIESLKLQEELAKSTKPIPKRRGYISIHNTNRLSTSRMNLFNTQVDSERRGMITGQKSFDDLLGKQRPASIYVVSDNHETGVPIYQQQWSNTLPSGGFVPYQYQYEYEEEEEEETQKEISLAQMARQRNRPHFVEFSQEMSSRKAIPIPPKDRSNSILPKPKTIDRFNISAERNFHNKNNPAFSRSQSISNQGNKNVVVVSVPAADGTEKVISKSPPPVSKSNPQLSTSDVSGKGLSNTQNANRPPPISTNNQTGANQGKQQPTTSQPNPIQKKPGQRPQSVAIMSGDSKADDNKLKSPTLRPTAKQPPWVKPQQTNQTNSRNPSQPPQKQTAKQPPWAKPQQSQGLATGTSKTSPSNIGKAVPAAKSSSQISQAPSKTSATNQPKTNFATQQTPRPGVSLQNRPASLTKQPPNSARPAIQPKPANPSIQPKPANPSNNQAIKTTGPAAQNKPVAQASMGMKPATQLKPVQIGINQPQALKPAGPQSNASKPVNTTNAPAVAAQPRSNIVNPSTARPVGATQAKPVGQQQQVNTARPAGAQSQIKPTTTSAKPTVGQAPASARPTSTVAHPISNTKPSTQGNTNSNLAPKPRTAANQPNTQQRKSGGVVNSPITQVKTNNTAQQTNAPNQNSNAIKPKPTLLTGQIPLRQKPTGTATINRQSARIPSPKKI